MGKEKLISEIINRSVSSVWEEAKLEWFLDNVYISDEPDTCLCGKTPIKEVCILKNRNNGKDAKVGSCCVKKFIGLPSDKILKAVNRVRNDVEKSLNVEALKYAKEKGLIGDWDYNFYISVGAKRSLSEKQWDSKIKINEKFLRRMRQKSVLGKLS